MSTSEAGKGDKRRPMTISHTKYGENWDKIFKKKKKSTGGKDEKSKTVKHIPKP